MKQFLFLAMVITGFAASPALAKEFNAKNCTYNGTPLYGRVKVVDHFADIKVKVVKHWGKLKVQQVNHFADSCGKWQMVKSFPDFTIQFVNHSSDIDIQYVKHFPGVK